MSINKLLVGDLHQKFNNLESIDKVFSLIKETINNDISEIVFLGDVYDTKAIIRSEVQNFFIKKLYELEKLDVIITILVGNHDYENQDCQNHSLEPLKYLSENIVIIDKPTISTFGTAYLPYINNNESFKDAVISLCKKDPNLKYIYCHQGFLGFDYGNGFLDDSGINIQNEFPKIKFISGHYHKMQRKDNVFYLGTPLSHSFGEVDQEKFIAIQRNDKIEMIPTGNIVPRHKRVFIDDGVLQDDLDIKNNDIVEIIVKCKKSEILKYDKKWAESILNGKNNNFILKYEINDSQENVRLSENLTYEQMLEKYLISKEKTYLFDLGRKILKDANL